MLNHLKNKKILILGLGKEGIDNFKFFRRLFPDKILGIADRLKISELESKVLNLIKDDNKIQLHLGENYLKALKNYQLIIRSPGIPTKVILPFLTKKQKITSQTEIFLENCPGKIIGITGTKGKSTTAFLIYKILKEGGIKVHLVGNIGRPVLNFLFSATPKNVYVYELSSFQLENLKKSPQIALFLNIYPEHLDYHKNFKEYLKAKQNITRYQGKEDFFIYNVQDPWIKKIAKISKAKKIPFKISSNIFIDIGISKPSLLQKHNLLSIAGAIEVTKIFKVKKEKIKRAIKNLKFLPHRLEYLGVFKGVKFYNDSLSTIPETTIKALDSLDNKVETIILGGFDRGLDFKNLAKKILKERIKTLILFPRTGIKIWESVYQLSKNQNYLPNHFLVNNMKEAVKLAFDYTSKGKICLFSPASPSFGIFQNYKERGNLFKKYIKRYAQR